MEIQIKRIYEEPSPSDGTRVLVDRVWPRGVSKERAALDLWLKGVAPSTELRAWFGHAPARWPEFQDRYRAELAAMPEEVRKLRELAHSGRLTLLYGARDTERNQAVVLRDFLME